MLSTQIKSVLRDKVNIAYIITIIVIFIFLNIGINLSSVFDSYYDNKVKEIVDEENMYYIRKLYISNPEITLTKEQQEQIKKIKYVEEFKIETIEIPNQTFYCYVIIVDDWKHCDYVKNLFDNRGIELLDSGGSIQYDVILESYKNVKNTSEVIKYLAIIVSICIMLLIYSNILKNQKNNLKLLKTIGYNSHKIKKITYTNLVVLTLIGCIAGTMILIGLFTLIKAITIEPIKINLIKNIIINILIFTFTLIISTTRIIRYNKLVT